MKELDVSVISTEMDLALFTNRTYQNKVHNALKSIRQKCNVKEKYAVACYEDYVVLYDQQRHIIAMQEF